MAGKLSLRRQSAGTSAISFFEAHGDEIATGVDQRLNPFYMEEEAKVDFKKGLEVVGRFMQDSLDRVIAADKANLDEQANDIRPNLELREAGEEVQQQLVFTRRMLTGFYGVELANEILATDGPAANPDQPLLLWRQAEQTAERLRSTPFDEPPRRTTSSFQFDPVKLADELEPPLGRLKAAYEAVVLERRKLESTVTEKAASTEAFDTDFRDCLRFGVGLCRLAGRPDLAGRLNASMLTAPRRRGSSEGSTPEPEDEPAPSADDPQPPAETGSSDPQEAA